MPLDPSISLGIKPPDIAGNMAQWGNLGLLRNQLQISNATVEPTIAQRIAESQLQQNAAKVSTATVPAQINLTNQQSATATETTKQQQLSTGIQQLRQLRQQALNLYTKPDLSRDDVISSLDATAKTMNVSPDMVEQAKASMPPAGASKEMLRNYLAHGIVSSLSAENQVSATFPNMQLVPTGGSIVPTTSGAPGVAAFTPGVPTGAPPIATTLPATAEEYNPVTQQKQYIGQAPGRPGPVSTTPPLGQEAGISAQVGSNADHFKTVQASADAAPTRIGVLQEIKQLAPQALTGDQPGFKTLVSKIAGYLGIDAAKIAQTPTDVLAKESALLATQSGATDLARLMNEAATPNAHMTEAAIQRTADQLIGMEKAKQAAGQFFANTPLDSPAYIQKRNQWQTLGDPRIFEYAAKSPADQAKMRAELQKSGQWKELVQKGLQLDKLGISPQ
jgi:hypothetical protein